MANVNELTLKELEELRLHLASNCPEIVEQHEKMQSYVSSNPNPIKLSERVMETVEGLVLSELEELKMRLAFLERYLLVPTEIQFVKASATAVEPVKATSGSNAFDLTADIATEVWIAPGTVVKLGTGIKLNIADPELAAVILPRSSAGGDKLGLANTIGLIDSDYQGEIFLKVKNLSATEPLIIKPGDRIAQMVIVRAPDVYLAEVSRFSEPTNRGEGGDGSTGKAALYG